MAPQEVQVQQKREVEKERESTIPARRYLPIVLQKSDAID
jgi:hypothetical protein